MTFYNVDIIPLVIFTRWTESPSWILQGGRNPSCQMDKISPQTKTPPALHCKGFVDRGTSAILWPYRASAWPGGVRVSCLNCKIHQPIDNVLFYSVFQTFHRKKNRQFSCLKMSLNPEGPLGSYLCDITVPALKDFWSCVSFFSMDKKVNKGFFHWVKSICISFFFSG